MFAKKPKFLPKEDVTAYRTAAVVLYVLFFIGLVYGCMSFLFPYNKYTFDFKNPDATKNTIFSLQREDSSFIRDGKVPANDALTFYANNWHILESGVIKLYPRNGEPSLTGKRISVRHGWAAIFRPESEQILNFPEFKVIEYQGTFYKVDNGTLLPFVSKNAALSHVPETAIRKLSEEEFGRFTVGDEVLGFRVGTLISYADGVFVVTEEVTVRPFGSPKILLRLGYSFQHVIPAAADEFGIYKRGKIILPGQVHPSGTLFQDADTGENFLYQENQLFPLAEPYAEFLKSAHDVVLFSRKDSTVPRAECALEKEFLRQSYACKVHITFSHGIGDDYQVVFENGDTMVDLEAITVGFQASRKSENAQYVSILLINRILERFGIQRE